ncbi:thioredoxin fold domain-containing protein [Acidithiobacillus caldus]|nr:thioredoxin fold domain-containing protein [Acidithiobacillus caldus]
MRKSLLSIAMGTVLMTGAWSAAAIASPPAGSAGYAALMHTLSHGQERLLKTVPTSVPGLTGLVGEAYTGQKSLVFGLDNRYLIVGPIIGANGKVLNATLAQSAGLLPKPLSVKVLALRALHAPGFVLGHAGPMLVAFMDPNCIFCHRFYESERANLKAGKLRIKVVPVGFLKPSSLPKAVSILEAKHPAAAWAADEAGFNVKTEEGAAKPAANLKVPATAQIQANTRLLARSGEVATPTIIACLKGAAAPVLWRGISPEAHKNIPGKLMDLLPTGSCAG